MANRPSTKKKIPTKKNKIKQNSAFPWIWIGGILLLTFLVFLPSLQNGITNWDDEQYITQNALLQSLSFDNLRAIFSTPVMGNYHPITILSLAFNHQFSGFNLFGYHFTNVLLHVLNTGLVFWFIYLLTKQKLVIALTVALLFGIHPLHVESVSWLSERKDVLYSFFFLLGLINYLFYQKQQQLKYYAYTFIFFLLAVLSKPAAVIFPLVLLLIDYWQNKDFQLKTILPKLPFFAIALLMGLVTITVQSEVGVLAMDEFAQHTFLHKILFASYGFMVYIFKLLIPIHLSAYYPYPSISNNEVGFLYYLMPIIVIALFVSSFIFRKKAKPILFGLLFYSVNVVLVLQLVSVGRVIMAERYVYLATIGIFFILAYYLQTLVDNKRLWKKVKPIVLSLGIIYLLGLAYTTFQRTKIWKNSNTLWSSVIEAYPNTALAYYNRGLYFFNKKQQIPAALQDYQKAIEVAPNYYEALYNTAYLLEKQKQNEKAKEYLDKALKIKTEGKAYLLEGNIYSNINQLEKSIESYTKSIAVEPTFAKAYLSRGTRYYQLKQLDAGLKDLNKAVELDPNFGTSYLNRSVVHSALGNKEKAVQDALKAKELGTVVNQQYFDSLQK